MDKYTVQAFLQKQLIHLPRTGPLDLVILRHYGKSHIAPCWSKMAVTCTLIGCWM